MRGRLLLVLLCGCGARTELWTPADASAPVVDARAPVDVVIAPDVATQSSEPTVLVTSDVPIYAISVDDKNVYWTQGYWPLAHAPALPLAMQCDKKKCDAPVTLASGTEVPLSIAVDHDSVYWTDGAPQWPDSAVLGLFRCAIGGCAQTPQTLVPGPAHGVEMQAGRLFWVGTNEIGECASGNCTPGSATTFAGVDTVKSDGAYAYWSTDTSIMRCPLASGACASPGVVVVPDAPATTLGEMVPTFRRFTMDSENLYWLSHGELRRCPKDGCATPTTIMPYDNTAARCIATDGVNVYWTAPLAVVRCPVTGCDKPIRVFMSFHEELNCVTLDATHVYWTTGPVAGQYHPSNPGSIMTTLKP